MLRLASLLIAIQTLLAERTGLLIRFGVDGKPDVDWSGTIEPAPARLYGWQFDSRDSVSGASWKCVPRRQNYWDTPYERSMKGTSRRDKLTAKGVVAEFDAGVREIEVRTAQGSFRARVDVPAKVLDGRAEIVPVPAVETLARDVEADDHPSLVESRDGTLWLAWIRYERDGDRVYVRRRGSGGWGAPEPVSAAGGDLFRTAMALDKNGRVWVIWSAQVDGNFDLYGRAWDGRQWSNVDRLTMAGGSDIYHAAATDRSGVVHLVWMSARNGNFDIYTKRFDGKSWSADERVSESPANDWEPAVAAAPNGGVAIVWDTYDRGNYDVVMRTVSGGKLGPARAIASSGAFEARASARYDASGALWIAYEQGDWNWGKDYGQGIEENGRGLLVRRTVRLVRLRNGRLEEPAAPLAGAVPEDFQQAVLAPRLALDRGGAPWVFFRYRVNLPGPERGGEASNRAVWRPGGARLGENGWEFIEIPEGWGRIDAPAALITSRDGVIHAVWPADNRSWPLGQPGPYDLMAMAVTAAAGRVGPMKPFEPDGENLRVRHEREAADIARVRAYRARVNGKEYRIVRGDIHRHTDISWDGNRDGSLHDAYRYALDAVGFDYLGV